MDGDKRGHQLIGEYFREIKEMLMNLIFLRKFYDRIYCKNVKENIKNEI